MRRIGFFFTTFLFFLMHIVVPVLSSKAFAQGQDSTPADRDIMVMHELLSGYYSNANQAYFDVRLKQPESMRHQAINWQVAPVEFAGLGNRVFSVKQTLGGQESHMLLSFSVDFEQQMVRMQTHALSSAFNSDTASPEYLPGCDLLWRQEAGQYRGRLAKSECNMPLVPKDLMLSPESLWLSFEPVEETQHGNHFAMDKARNFSCYADVPGVGGGRDIPFERDKLDGMHDMGSEKWFTTKEGQQVGVNLFKVMWTFNNYEDAFARPSLVVYVKTKTKTEQRDEQTTTEVSYAWTEANAQRVGINLKWVLVNCYMLSNENVIPFFKNNEPRL